MSKSHHVALNEVAFDLFLAGKRRSAISNQIENFQNDPRLKEDRALYRKLARRAIDFACDEACGLHAECVVCGCSDGEACPEGCSWIVVNRFIGKGVCSSCVVPESITDIEKRWTEEAKP